MNLFKAGKSLFKKSGDEGSAFSPMAMFQALDKNGDGKITEEDFILVVEQLGLGEVGETAAKQAFEQVDANGNGKLDFSEALGALEKIKALLAGLKGQSAAASSE